MQNAVNIDIGPNPDWHGAATNLVFCLSEVDSSDVRVLVLDKLARKLDGQMYPAFLRILYTIAVNGEPEAKFEARRLELIRCHLLDGFSLDDANAVQLTPSQECAAKAEVVVGSGTQSAAA